MKTYSCRRRPGLFVMFIIYSLCSILLFTLFISTANATQSVPAGFMLYRFQRIDSFRGLVPEESWRVITKRVNKTDRLKPGKTFLIPISVEAEYYVPVPRWYRTNYHRVVVVFISEQLLGVYENNKLVFWTAVSTGTPRRPTKTGSHSVKSKQREKISSIYGLSMNLALHYSGNYFLHEGALPGYPASHGCIRVLRDDAEELFNLLQIGDGVKVVP